MHQAVDRLRDGAIGDEAGVRAGTAQLLEYLAGRDDLDVHVFDRVAGLANRVLAPDPYKVMDDVKPTNPSYADNGQPHHLKEHG